VLLKLAEFILRIKEYRYNIGRIKVGFKVILIELLLANVTGGYRGAGGA
jgi:hypothetical protein